MTRSHLLTWSLCALVLAVARLGPGVATPARAAELRPAERLHEAAVSAYKRGKLRQAVELWRDALKLEPSWKYAYNLANTLYELSDPAEAWAALAQADALGPPPKYAGLVAELRSKVRAERFKDHAWLVVTIAPPGATVTRDGVVWDPPWELWTTATSSLVEVREAGYVTARRTIVHPVGERTEVAFALERMAPEVVAPGRLVVSGAPAGARVTVDGRDVGALPAAALELPPGEVEVEVTHAGHVAERARVTIAAGQETPLAVTLARVAPPPKARALATPGWITLGAGVALAATGIGFVVWAGDTHDELAALNGSPEALARFASYEAYATHFTDTRSAMEDRALAGDVLLVAGGLAIATGIALVALDGGGGHTPPAAAHTLRLVPLPDGAALVGGGSF